MRRWFTFALALVVTLGMAADAHAGKKDKKKKDKGDDAAEESVSFELMMTEVEAVDSLFAKAKAPIDSINNASMKIDAVGANLNKALELPEGTPLNDALADLMSKAEGKIEFAMDGRKPSIKPGDAVPDNVKTAVDALQTSVDEAIAAAEALAEVPAQCMAIKDEIAGFDVGSLKDVPPTKLPKITKAISKNTGTLAKAPDAVKQLMTSLDMLKKNLTVGLTSS